MVPVDVMLKFLECIGKIFVWSGFPCLWRVSTSGKEVGGYWHATIILLRVHVFCFEIYFPDLKFLVNYGTKHRTTVHSQIMFTALFASSKFRNRWISPALPAILVLAPVASLRHQLTCWMLPTTGRFRFWGPGLVEYCTGSELNALKRLLLLLRLSKKPRLQV